MLPTAAFPASFTKAVDDLIERRAATQLFDPTHWLSDREITRLGDLATRAPSAFNLQNWRLHAVRTPEVKISLRAAALGQAKVEDAAVTFVVSGVSASATDLPERLLPAVQAGQMSSGLAAAWTKMARTTYWNDPQAAHDEAVRSASLLAATLIYAAEGRGLSTAPMSGFDRDAVRRLLNLPPDVIPILLVAVGRARPGNGLQKPRRPLSDVLSLV